MRNIRVVFAVLSLSVVLVAGVADELQAQEKRQGWIKRLTGGNYVGSCKVRFNYPELLLFILWL